MTFHPCIHVTTIYCEYPEVLHALMSMHVHHISSHSQKNNGSNNSKSLTYLLTISHLNTKIQHQSYSIILNISIFRKSVQSSSIPDFGLRTLFINQRSRIIISECLYDMTYIYFSLNENCIYPSLTITPPRRQARTCTHIATGTASDSRSWSLNPAISS